MTPRLRATPPQPSELLTISQGADYVGLSCVTLRRYIKAGRLTAYRTGPKLLRVDRCELDALVQPAAAPQGPG